VRRSESVRNLRPVKVAVGVEAAGMGEVLVEVGEEEIRDVKEEGVIIEYCVKNKRHGTEYNKWARCIIGSEGKMKQLLV
jgi:hypothetical protein